MRHRRSLCLAVVLMYISLVVGLRDTSPEQVHLSLGADATEMVVSWVTHNYTAPSIVEYGMQPFERKTSSPSPSKYVNGGVERRSMWMHRVVIKALIPGQRYVYHVGGPGGWSDAFWFNAMKKEGATWSPRFVVYGDLGSENAAALTDLQVGAQKGHFDAVLHIGDFAYDLHDDNGRLGDEFMRQIEPIAAYVPYMTCPGNHEFYYNFSQYKNRFSMPKGDARTMVYSFNVGPVHILSINTEVFYKHEFGRTEDVIKQYNWILNDLQRANVRAVRARIPWIIVVGHRPMYCSNEDVQCNTMYNPVREGLHPGARSYSLEDLFYKYGVDLQFYAHEHSYERLWPAYKGKVCNGSRSAYDNPPAPVHIVTGSAGCREKETTFDPVVFPWSAVHNMDYGYSRLQVLNASHLTLEQISSDKEGAVIDKMTLIKDKHGAGTFNCHD